MGIVPIPSETELPIVAAPSPPGQQQTQGAATFANVLQNVNGSAGPPPQAALREEPITMKSQGDAAAQASPSPAGSNRGASKKNQTITQDSNSSTMASIVALPLTIIPTALLPATVAGTPWFSTPPNSGQAASRLAAAAAVARPPAASLAVAIPSQAERSAVAALNLQAGGPVTSQQLASVPSSSLPLIETTQAGRPAATAATVPAGGLPTKGEITNGMPHSVTGLTPSSSSGAQRTQPPAWTAPVAGAPSIAANLDQSKTAASTTVSTSDTRLLKAQVQDEQTQNGATQNASAQTGPTQDIPEQSSSVPSSAVQGGAGQTGPVPSASAQSNPAQSSPTPAADPTAGAGNPNVSLAAIINQPASENALAGNAMLGGTDNLAVRSAQTTPPGKLQLEGESQHPAHAAVASPQMPVASMAPGGQASPPAIPAGTTATQLLAATQPRGSADAHSSPDQSHAELKTATSAGKAADGNSLPQAPNSSAPAVASGRAPADAPGSAVSAPQAALPASQSPATQNSAAQDPAAPAAKTQPSAPASGPSEAPPPGGGMVQRAQIADGASQSEMRIDLRTQAFGSVEVHTVVHGTQIGLEVGSEKGDLRAFLSPEVSGLQSAFRQQDLHFDSIRFLSRGAGVETGLSGEADAQSRSFRQGRSAPLGDPGNNAGGQSLGEPEVSANSPTGLNVHA